MGSGTLLTSSQAFLPELERLRPHGQGHRSLAGLTRERGLARECGLNRGCGLAHLGLQFPSHKHPRGDGECLDHQVPPLRMDGGTSDTGVIAFPWLCCSCPPRRPGGLCLALLVLTWKWEVAFNALLPQNSCLT